MTGASDAARLERERLSVVERRARLRAEARDVAEGIDETVRLSRGRGAGFETPTRRRGEREGTYRRLTGLDWLAKKGRLTPHQHGAGERYGAVFRKAAAEASIGSTLDLAPGGGAATGTPVRAVLAMAETRMQARAKLAFYRRRLGGQPDLVAACDLICGRELTPREAVATEREVARLEAVLQVALDLLAAGEG